MESLLHNTHFWAIFSTILSGMIGAFVAIIGIVLGSSLQRASLKMVEASRYFLDESLEPFLAMITAELTQQRIIRSSVEQKEPVWIKEVPLFSFLKDMRILRISELDPNLFRLCETIMDDASRLHQWSHQMQKTYLDVSGSSEKLKKLIERHRSISVEITESLTILQRAVTILRSCPDLRSKSRLKKLHGRRDWRSLLEQVPNRLPGEKDDSQCGHLV